MYPFPVSIFASPVQVQLLNNPNILRDYILPIASILISFGTFCWTIWNNHRNKSKIKLDVAVSFTASGIDLSDNNYLTIKAIQVGQSGRDTVTSMGLRMKTRENTLQQIPRPGDISTPLPVTLSAAEVATLYFPLAGIAEQCVNNQIDPNDLYPFATTVLGSVKGKMTKLTIEMIHNEINRITGTRNSN
jgi:hypothetical protein